MLSNGLRHTPEKKFLQPLASVRPEQNEVRMPVGGNLKDSDAGFSFDHAGLDAREAGGMQFLGGMLHDFLRTAAAFLQGGILLEKGGGLDHVNEKDFRALGTHLLDKNLSRRFRELRTIDGQYDFHGLTPFPLLVVHLEDNVETTGVDCRAQVAEDANGR